MLTPAIIPVLIRQCCRIVIMMTLFGTLAATLACIDGFPQSILPGRAERDVGKVREVTLVRTEPAPTGTKPFAASATTELLTATPTEPAPTKMGPPTASPTMELPTVAPESSSATIDRAALIALYNATGGPNWRNNRRWLSDAPIEKWFGVVTDHDGSVTQLFLENNQLTGAIPSEIGRLTNLEWLWLQDNQLTGEIPAELSNLANLEQLWLSHNQLTGVIPAELGHLTNLEGLGLGHNQLTGAIPPELGNLTYLDNLHLQYNQLTASHRRTVQLSNLRVSLQREQVDGVPTLPLEICLRQ